MALAEDTVREALKQVIDPELYVNIVDLGLIYVVEIGDEKEDGRHDVNDRDDDDQPHVSGRTAAGSRHQVRCRGVG